MEKKVTKKKKKNKIINIKPFKNKKLQVEKAQTVQIKELKSELNTLEKKIEDRKIDDSHFQLLISSRNVMMNVINWHDNAGVVNGVKTNVIKEAAQNLNNVVRILSQQKRSENEILKEMKDIKSNLTSIEENLLEQVKKLHNRIRNKSSNRESGFIYAMTSISDSPFVRK